MLFKNKKSENKTSQNPDKQVHRTFQVGAIFVILFIGYNLYFGGEQKNPAAVSDAQINAKMKAVFDKMAASPEFKEVRDFVSYMKSNTEKDKTKILDTTDGIIIYIPAKLISDSVAAENEKISISAKIIQKTAVDKVDSPVSKSESPKN
jgi:hypothetical protein